jgi:hypothetical protein
MRCWPSLGNAKVLEAPITFPAETLRNVAIGAVRQQPAVTIDLLLILDSVQIVTTEDCNATYPFLHRELPQHRAGNF